MGALLHDLQAVAAFLPALAEPAAIVPNGQQDRLVFSDNLLLQNNRDGPGAGVLADVGERLLQDARKLDFGQRSEVQLTVDPVIKAGLDLSLEAELSQIFVDRLNQAFIAREGRPQA